METAASVVDLARVRDLVRTGVARSIRVAAGISLSELAREIGVSPAAVCRWEANQRTPRGPAAVRYGEALDALMRRRA
jgi:transcriptional regulator with XRE-family HTH domain